MPYATSTPSRVNQPQLAESRETQGRESRYATWCSPAARTGATPPIRAPEGHLGPFCTASRNSRTWALLMTETYCFARPRTLLRN